MAQDVREREWTPHRPGTRPLAPRRDVKLQVCLSADERARLEAQAAAGGYESVSSLIRARTLGVGAPAGGGVS